MVIIPSHSFPKTKTLPSSRSLFILYALLAQINQMLTVWAKKENILLSVLKTQCIYGKSTKKHMTFQSLKLCIVGFDIYEIILINFVWACEGTEDCFILACSSLI